MSSLSSFSSLSDEELKELKELRRADFVHTDGESGNDLRAHCLAWPKLAHQRVTAAAQDEDFN